MTFPTWGAIGIAVVFQIVAVFAAQFFIMQYTKRGKEFEAWRRAKKKEKEERLQQLVAQAIEKGDPSAAYRVISEVRDFKADAL